MNHVFLTHSSLSFVASPLSILGKTWRPLRTASHSRLLSVTVSQFARQTRKRVDPLLDDAPHRTRKSMFRAPKAVISDVFGKNFDPSTGSKVLYELHKRRITGSLIDRGIQLDEDVTPAQATKALQWLREKYPIDEAAAAGWYAEKEIQAHKDRISNQFITKATRLGFIDPKIKKKKKDPTQDVMEDSFIQERVQEYNKKRAIREEAKKKAEEEANAAFEERQAQYAIEIIKQKELLDEKREEKFKRWDKLAEEAQIPIQEITDPTRSSFSRLAAPTVFALTLIAALTFLLSPQSITISTTISPASSDANRSAIITCSVITAVHLALYLAWRRPELMAAMNRYFMLSAGAPRPFSVLGAVLSHQFIYWHLATNAVVLFLVGMPLHEEVGRWNFLAIYFISGLFGNVGTLWWHVLRKNFIHASSGASGALYGVLGAFFTVQPERELSIPGMNDRITYNSWYGVAAMAVLLVVETRRKTVDHLVHMSGFVAGVLIGWVLRTLKSEEQPKDTTNESNSVS